MSITPPTRDQRQSHTGLFFRFSVTRRFSVSVLTGPTIGRLREIEHLDLKLYRMILGKSLPDSRIADFSTSRHVAQTCVILGILVIGILCLISSSSCKLISTVFRYFQFPSVAYCHGNPPEITATENLSATLKNDFERPPIINRNRCMNLRYSGVGS